MQLGDTLRLQAQTLYLQKRYPAAEAIIKATLEIYRAGAGPTYVNYPTALVIQGLIYGQTGRTAEAEKLLREAVQLRREQVDPSHFLHATATGALGEFLTAQNRFAEAEPLLLASYESFRKSQSPESPRIRLARQRLVVLYENWGKPGDATAIANEPGRKRP
ncbi:MAG: tetratricopeptide repeat protein [Verrucomicrobiota bacterium]|nr:tetratricopeptide repeat protein [Verrucomicrobiota bacterium]